MNAFPAQGGNMQPDPQYWGQMYGGRSNPFDAMRQQRISAIPGKMVQMEENIKPGDVPMDGSVALFPLQDMSCIYGKAWNTNGQIITVKYIPEQSPQQVSQTSQVDPFQSMVDTRLSSIEETLSKLISSKNTEVKTTKKKEENNK